MRMFKITICDEGAGFEFYASERSIPKMFDPSDAAVIADLISMMIRGCRSIEQRVNGIDYMVEEIKPCTRKRGSLDALI